MLAVDAREELREEEGVIQPAWLVKEDFRKGILIGS